MRDLFIIMSVLGSLPLILARPYVGILIWCWLSYMNPHRLSWGPAFEMPLAMIVAVTTLLAWIPSREPKRIPFTAVTALMLSLAVWVSVTTLFALVPDSAVEKWEEVMKIFLMTFVAIALATTKERIHALVLAIVLSLGFYAAKGGVFTLLTGGSSRVWGPPGSFIADNNALGLALLTTIPLLWYLHMQTAHRWIRWGLIGGMILAVLAVLGTQSRGAFLGAVAVSSFLVLKSRNRVAIGLIVLALGIAAAAFVPDSWVSRMQPIRTYTEDGSAQGRIDAWTYGYRLALERPLTGGGFRSYGDAASYSRLVPDAPRHQAYHSIYFEVLGDHGFVGLALFLGLALSCWFTASRIVRLAAGHPDLSWAHDLAGMLQVSMVAYAVAGAFQNLAFSDLILHLAALTVVTHRCVRASLARNGMRWAPSRVLGARHTDVPEERGAGTAAARLGGTA